MPRPKMPENKVKKVVSLRFTPKELERLKALAEENDLTLSELLRNKALGKAKVYRRPRALERKPRSLSK